MFEILPIFFEILPKKLIAPGNQTQKCPGFDTDPVGWCATKGKPLVPPKTIHSKYNDWKDYLVKCLTGARTLPTNFYKVSGTKEVLLIVRV